MVYNPYAKKRPRPAGWGATASIDSQASGSRGSVSRPLPTSAVSDKHQDHGPRILGAPERSMNQKHQIDRDFAKSGSHMYEKVQQGVLGRIGNKSFRTSDRLPAAAAAATTISTTMVSLPKATRRPLQKRALLSNPYMKNSASNDSGILSKLPPTLPSRTIRPPTQNPIRDSYGTTNSNHTIVSTLPNKTSLSTISSTAMNDPCSMQKTQPNNPYVKTTARNDTIGLTRRNSYGKDARNSVSSKETGGNSLIHGKMRLPQPKVPSVVDGIAPVVRGESAMNTTVALPSRMASIRPASWQKTTTSANASSRSQPIPTVSTKSVSNHSYGNSSSQNDTTNQPQHRHQKIEDTADWLPPELAYSPDEVKPIQDQYRMPLIKNANLSAPLRNGWTLFPHQKKAIIRGLTMRRMILALDMGLGKTLIGAVWSKAFKDTFGHNKLKVYVICPVTLKEEWKRTAEEKVGLGVEEDQPGRGSKSNARKTKKPAKRKKSHQDGDCQIEDVDKMHGSDLKMSICSWAKVPKAIEPCVEHFVVCCDEAHAMQSTQSQRTKDVLNLVHDKRCVGVLLLTGTPMKNGKPGNLFPLLKAVRHPLGRHQKAYEAHFCNGMIKNFGRGPQWDACGASNLDQLRRKVASNLLHMTKEQCLTELPPMTKIFHDVPVSSRFQVQYEQSIKNLASIQANSSNMREEAVLGAVQRLRVVCAAAKVDATVEMARSILNKEPAIVIFSSFAQVAKSIHSKLVASKWQCSLLTGETPKKKRQEMVDRFQKGLSAVFVCTFGAGGVGLTLTAASTIILLDRPWTPGETRQAEDRIRRIGQVKDCTSYWIRSFDLDKQIDGMLESKSQTANAVLDKNGNQSSTTGGGGGKISITQLVHKFVVSESRKQL
ncbi:unnamed protein product [Pseudo-nitzschia multistriata]|uniref:Helicase ATP-binding domain-containing protein n=1 Tax=Pseudo-nitzschia multistriata TaxID=183589 RepID=A0A448Z818_9STRA|nr:unnamed protein product [Pseudo-nitzschia multistriata]